MNVLGFLASFFLVGAALTILSFSSPTDLLFTKAIDTSTLYTASRKLKENGTNVRGNKKGDASGYVNLDDYQPIDPLPSSMASIRPGPIDHGTPLNPFIPKPSPPAPAPPTIIGGST